MNRKQLIIMWIGIAIFIYFGLTTKTHYTYGGPRSRYGGNNVALTDYGPVAVRLLGTILVTAGLMYTLKTKKSKDEKDNK